MPKRLGNVFRFAMPFLQASLIKQILVGSVLGALLAWYNQEWAVEFGFVGTMFVSALKGVAPVLVFILVMSAIAAQDNSEQMHLRPILGLYVLSTLGSAFTAVAASFIFPSKISLLGHSAAITPPGGIDEVLHTLLLNIVDNPVHAVSTGNYIGILAWAIACGVVLRHSRPETRIVLTDASRAVEFVVQLVIRFAPIGIMGLVSKTLAEEGFQVMWGYAHLLGVLIGAMAFVALVLNPILVWWATRQNPYPLVFMCLRESGVSAFFTRSLAANIPMNMEICRREGLPESTYAVSIPVGSTVNMAGAAVTITVITLAAANSLGIEVGLGAALFLSIVASICAAGTSGVPGGSLMLIPLACGLFGIDNDIASQVVAVGFILSVLQDSTETGLNSSSDVLFTIAGCRRAERLKKAVK